jgi:hypothetical protein
VRPVTSLGAPPPRRSRRERLSLPSTRILLAGAVTVAALVALLLWRPWQQGSRTSWTAPPTVPASLDAPQTGFANRLAAWVGFVRDAEEDPRSQAVQGCQRRLDRVGPAPAGLEDLRRLAADACSALANSARHHNTALLSVNAALLGKAQRERAEGDHDLALLVAALGLRRAPGGQVDARLSRIASQLARRSVSARCFASDADWRAVEDSVGRTEQGVTRLFGFAVYSQSRIDLSPEVCRTLASIASASFDPATEAIEVLTHESEHLAGVDGIQNEARTDCYAAQRLALTARLLGRPSGEARTMGAYYLRFHQPGLPAEYRSRECRNGGRFDLRPADPRFP